MLSEDLILLSGERLANTWESRQNIWGHHFYPEGGTHFSENSVEYHSPVSRSPEVNYFGKRSGVAQVPQFMTRPLSLAHRF
jgi:hypothetical protein